MIKLENIFDQGYSKRDHGLKNTLFSDVSNIKPAPCVTQTDPVSDVTTRLYPQTDPVSDVTARVYPQKASNLFLQYNNNYQSEASNEKDDNFESEERRFAKQSAGEYEMEINFLDSSPGLRKVRETCPGYSGSIESSPEEDFRWISSETRGFREPSEDPLSEPEDSPKTRLEFI